MFGGRLGGHVLVPVGADAGGAAVDAAGRGDLRAASQTSSTRFIASVPGTGCAAPSARRTTSSTPRPTPSRTTRPVEAAAGQRSATCPRSRDDIRPKLPSIRARHSILLADHPLPRINTGAVDKSIQIRRTLHDVIQPGKGQLMIQFDAVHKRFPNGTTAVHDLSLDMPDGERDRAGRPVGLRQDHHPADDQPADRADLGHDPDRRPGRHRAATRSSCAAASATSSSRSACSRT